MSSSAWENATAERSIGISVAGRPPQMTMPLRSTKPRAFIRSSSEAGDIRSLIVGLVMAMPTPRWRLSRVSASTRSTMPRPARSARHSSSRITK
jgi:hypothetical protein